MDGIIAFLKRIYSRIGHRGIMLSLYAFFLAIHTILSLAVYLPTIDPNEFSAAAVAAYFTGSDWSSAMSLNSYYYGFLQAALYTPIMLFTRDPFLQYKLMVILGGAILSLIPVLVYSTSFKIGARKPWQAGLCALICGGYVTYFAHSNFIWNETMAIFFPWFIAWIFFRIYHRYSGKTAKVGSSLVFGAVLALAPAAHYRLYAVVLAVFVTLILARAVFKKKIVRWVSFISSFVLFGALQKMASMALQSALWHTLDPSRLNNTPENFFANVGAAMSDGGVWRFIQTMLAQIFYFCVSSWGLGALGISLLVVIIVRLVKSRKEKAPPPFADEYVLFGIFAFFSVIFTLFISCCYKFGSDAFYTQQDTILFGRYLDSVTPLAMLLALLFVFMYGLKLKHIAGGAAALLLSSAFYFAFALPVTLGATTARMSPILAIYPLLIGENSTTVLDFTSVLAAASCAMCILALFVVIVSCAEKTKSVIISVFFLLSTIYSGIYVGAYYIPLCTSESVSKNKVYTEISSHIYNQAEAPEVTVYRGARNAVAMIQYLNQNITVYSASDVHDIVENTFVVVPKGEIIRFPTVNKRIVFTEIASVGDYSIYAYGEKALAYAQSQK